MGSGCEDEANKAALNTCRASLESLQKTSTAEVASASALKQELAQSQSKVEELTKEVDQLKTSKSGKAEASPAKPAMASKKGKTKT